MKLYRSVPKIVHAEPLSGVDFLMEDRSRTINNGSKIADPRPGFKIVDGVSVSWMDAASLYGKDGRGPQRKGSK